MNIDFDTIIKKMLLKGKLKNTSELARVLGVTPQTISNAKKRGSFPAKHILRFSTIYDVSIDWLIDQQIEPACPACRTGNGHFTLDFMEDEYILKLLKLLRVGGPEIGGAVRIMIDSLAEMDLAEAAVVKERRTCKVGPG